MKDIIRITPDDIDVNLLLKKYSEFKDFNQFIANLIKMCRFGGNVWLVDWTARKYENHTSFIWKTDYRNTCLEYNLLDITYNTTCLNTFNFTGKFFVSILPFVKGGLR